MKLLRLKIHEPFRSLQAGFELHFMREWNHSEHTDRSAPYVLAGPNGSGKSNVLEVLAAIFYHLECQYLDYRPESFDFDEDKNPDGFQEEQAVPNGFELEYLIPLPPSPESDMEGLEPHAHVKVVKSQQGKSGAKLFWLNNAEYGIEKPLSRTMSKALLPHFVLGYSSGENEILSLPFFKIRFIQLDEYFDSLRREMPYPGTPESRHTFLDSNFSQAILLCNLLFHDEETLKPFRHEIGIQGIQQFRITLKHTFEILPDQLKYFNDFPERLVLKEVDDAGREVFQFNILNGFPDLIERFKRCATSFFHDVETDTLYLDYCVNTATKESFRNNFSFAIDLFQFFQILLTLNNYSVNEELKKELYSSNSLYVAETVPTLPFTEQILRFENLILKKQDIDSILYAKALSDGEHQLLHCLGLCLLYKDTNSLFLLDEPETHFNPDWRSQLISRLCECFNKSDQHQRELLITTHSPFLISDSRPEKVMVFEKTNGEVKVSPPGFNTLGASINKITMKTFNKRETIGGYAKQVLDDLKSRFEAGEDPDLIIDEINSNLGDSVEKILLIKTILDSMEGESN